MAIQIASAMTLTTALYTKTANLITGRNQFLPKGRIQLIAFTSAIGNNLTLTIGGVPLVEDQPSVYVGGTGGMNVKDHVVVDQVIAGGTAEFYIRNTTGASLTTDYAIYFTPM